MKRILLTGASSGIGAAAVSVLLARGHRVWGTARDPARLDTGTGVRPLAMDLLDPPSIDAALAGMLADAGGIDVLVNNAGSGVLGHTECFDDAALARQFQVLVFGPMRLARGALAAMREQGSGLIVNVSSLATDFPVPGLGPYSAAKAALASLTASLAMELSAQPELRVVDLAPGDVDTGFNRAMPSLAAAAGSARARELERLRAVLDRHLKSGPAPRRVAELLARVVESPPPGGSRLSVGNGLQTVLAPLGARLLPKRSMAAILRRYYGL